MAGTIAEWQRRLDTEGSVRFRPNPWLTLLVLALCVAVTIGTVDAIVRDGARVWSVCGLVAFGLVGLPLTIRWLVTGRGALTVASDGVHTSRGTVIPFEQIEAVSTRRGNITIDHHPLPGQLLGVRERSTGLKQQYASLPPFGGARSGDLAFWLLQLKAGPDARIDISGGGGRFAQVYQVGQKPFWER